jgi:hypothetical protein
MSPERHRVSSSSLACQPVLRLLHLSDIHFYEDEPANQPLNLDMAVRNRLLIDIGNLVGQLGRCDAVLVVGDIGARGAPADYAVAAQYLTGVTELVGCEADRVICVPGNHDINRHAHGPLHHAIRQQLRTIDAGSLNDTLHALLKDATSAAVLLSPFEAYNEFALAFGCDISATAPVWRPKALSLGTRKLVIHGVTSSWIADATDDQSSDSTRLVVGAFQFAGVGADPEDITMTLCHHPSSWLRDAVEVDQWGSAAHLILTGHEHSFGIRVADDRQRAWVASGAVNPSRAEDGWFPSYNIIEIDDVGEDDRELSVRVYARCWREGAQFGPDARFGNPHLVGLNLDRTARPEPGPIEAEKPRELNDIHRSHAHRVMTAPPDRRRTVARELGLAEAPAAGLEGDRAILRWAIESGKLPELAARLVAESIDD